MAAHLLSVNVGTPLDYTWLGRTLRSSIAGDPVAAAIADRVADSMAVAAVAVARRLGLHGCEVRLAGQVLDPGHPVLHDRLVAALAERLPGGRPRRLGRPPVVGAVLAAARACGLPERHLNAIMSCFTPPGALAERGFTGSR